MAPPSVEALLDGVVAVPPRAAAAERSRAAGSTYREILRSSAVIGAASAVQLVIGIVRTKVLALLLGPSGIGLLGVYQSIVELTRSVAEMGISRSGVREIAQAAGTGDLQRAAVIATVLRRVAVALGLLGAVILIVAAGPVSEFALGSRDTEAGVALLSLAVLFRLIADGQGAQLQGLRRIADLARVNVVGACLGTILAIGFVGVLGENGIAPALVAIAGATLVVSTACVRKRGLPPVAVTPAQVRSEATTLLKLGVAFMASGLLMVGAAFAVRLLVLRQVGLEAAGLYQAAWTLAGLYVGFALQAMGTDFYPRLVAVIDDAPSTVRHVDEQAHVSLLLAGPGILATLTFAPLVLSLFYSAAFGAAVDVLRWLCLGMALRVVTWPMGYIVVAKNRRVLFFATELAWTCVNLGLSAWCVARFGLVGAGIAFFGSYLFHGVMIFAVVRRLCGFRWSPTTLRTGLGFIVSIGIVQAALCLLPSPWGIGIGALATAVSAAWSVRALLFLLDTDELPRPVRRALGALRAALPRRRKEAP